MKPRLDAEDWKPIPGYEGSYEVSDHGRVRSRNRTSTNSLGITRNIRGKVLSPRDIGDGHLQVVLYQGGRPMSLQVHRLVLAAFRGPCPDRHEVRHLNGMPGDNRLANLVYGTSAENKQDTLRHGRHRESSKTHCLRGHEYTPENTYTSPARNGIGVTRSCRTCASDRNRRQYAQRRVAA